VSKKVEIPALDWFERYKRLIDLAWGALLADEDFIFRNMGKEAYIKYGKETRPKWAGAAGRKISKKYGLKPTLEDATQLLGIYGQEIWGFGDTRFIEANLESPTKGTFAILACRGWETDKEHHIRTQCNMACGVRDG